MHLGSLKAILSIQSKSILKQMSRLGVVVHIRKTDRISSSRLAQATSEYPTSKKKTRGCVETSIQWKNATVCKVLLGSIAAL